MDTQHLTNENIDYVETCNCGAVTIHLSDELNPEVPYSMTKESFDKLFPNISLEDARKQYCCNHCSNNYGIDLCACGSGNKPEQCDNDYNECGEPMQTLGDIHRLTQWS